MSTRLLTVLLLLTVPALADVPPANTTGCSSKKVGDSCETDDKKSGACRDATCTRLDYSRGTPPRSIEAPCLKCDPKSGGCSSTAGVALPAGAFALMSLRRRR
ncbi:MAG: hypothetical protein JNJ54_05175 [Myxococcaceae bacterium]|nr:hypothetical protein [Myxococcaceae bacterium]